MCKPGISPEGPALYVWYLLSNFYMPSTPTGALVICSAERLLSILLVIAIWMCKHVSTSRCISCRVTTAAIRILLVFARRGWSQEHNFESSITEVRRNWRIEESCSVDSCQVIYWALPRKRNGLWYANRHGILRYEFLVGERMQCGRSNYEARELASR